MHRGDPIHTTTPANELRKKESSWLPSFSCLIIRRRDSAQSLAASSTTFAVQVKAERNRGLTGKLKTTFVI